MSERKRVLVAAFGDAGHAFPAIALARALTGRGHEVVVETWERWREPVEETGLGFTAAEEYRVFPPPPPGSDGPSAASAARALLPFVEEMRPHVVVSDILTLAPALAADAAGVPRATLIPHIYPVQEDGLPFFGFGLVAARTPIGRTLWRAGRPLLETGLRRGRRELNAERAALGLPPVERFHGGISERLALVATYPQLEYPRHWPAHVRITGPMFFELPHEDVELPDGDAPLVLVAPSTSQDPDHRLVRTAVEALADEPVRVVATTNREGVAPDVPTPANAMVVDWLSYAQVMPRASLVICHGGHGTVARALAEGVPVLVCPAIGDMAETGARVAWAGVGLMLPGRLLRPGPLRWAVRRLLTGEDFAGAAATVASRATDGAAEGARLVEELRGWGSNPQPLG
jgi:UDP:flavonoid glycosyltransferase YjiC (YdhE family)